MRRTARSALYGIHIRRLDVTRNMAQKYKVVVYVPREDAEKVKQAGELRPRLPCSSP